MNSIDRTLLTRFHEIRLGRLAVLAVLIGAWAAGLGCPKAEASDVVTQTFSLRGGWNSLWLDLQPTNDVPASVLNGLPVEQIWTYQERSPAVDFISDPSEPVWNRDRWMSWAPAGRPEAIGNSLFAITGHRAYLIKLSAPANLSVTGRPSLRTPVWQPDAYNLRGFPVDPGVAPTFREFFRTSSAHFDVQANAPRAIYEMDASGAWRLVTPTDLMQYGTAYWVFSSGSSDFVAPFEVSIAEGGLALDFGRRIRGLTVQARNRRSTPVDATLEQLPQPAEPTLATASFSSATGTAWEPLESLVEKNLLPGQTYGWRLAARRQSMTEAIHTSVVEVRDNLGTRYLIPVGIERVSVIATDTSRRNAGLWLGVASVAAVSEAHSGLLVTNSVATDGTPLSVSRVGVNPTPTPTRSAFPLRVLIHVDTEGTVRLLREVTQMWEDGSYRETTGGLREPATPGRLVLVTDPAKLSRFKGIEVRGEGITGRRFSTTGFDFPPTGPGNADNFITLTGTFAPGESVSGAISLPETFSTNPFRHKYHPDHDNLDARFAEFRAEAYAVRREFTFEVSTTDPGGAPPTPDYGYEELAGTYRETVTGLHREPIHAQGSFRLRRISEVAVLNP